MTDVLEEVSASLFRSKAHSFDVQI